MQLWNRIFGLTICMMFSLQPVFAQTVDEKSVVLQKFFVAIGLVLLCSGFLFGVLYLYKNFFNRQRTESSVTQKEVTLNSPNNISEAISIFLEKTKSNK